MASEILDWILKALGAVALVIGGALMKTRDRSIKNETDIKALADEVKNLKSSQLGKDDVREVVDVALDRYEMRFLERQKTFEEKLFYQIKVAAVEAVTESRRDGEGKRR